jgi:ATP-binding cassette subfamily D (ALD) long-chain fatty acid import protein
LTTLQSTTAEENIELEKEIEQLEGLLQQDVGIWESRLSEINQELKGVKA